VIIDCFNRIVLFLVIEFVMLHDFVIVNRGKYE
jgi:hypothetical protein